MIEEKRSKEMSDKLHKPANSREEFRQFVLDLYEDFQLNGDEWQNNKLGDFLEALSVYIEAVDGYYQNFKIDVDADKPSWRLFQDILLGATLYE